MVTYRFVTLFSGHVAGVVFGSGAKWSLGYMCRRSKTENSTRRKSHECVQTCGGDAWACLAHALQCLWDGRACCPARAMQLVICRFLRFHRRRHRTSRYANTQHHNKFLEDATTITTEQIPHVCMSLEQQTQPHITPSNTQNRY